MKSSTCVRAPVVWRGSFVIPLGGLQSGQLATIVLDLRPAFEPVHLGFVCQYLGLLYFMKQVAESAHPHAFGLIGKRLGVDIHTQALLQFVGSSECPLPWLFVLACVGELIALSAQKIAA